MTAGRGPDGLVDGGTDAARARLAARQTELLTALVAGGPVPPGFDPAQVRAQATGLAAKRRDTAAKVAPELPRLLGALYGPLFLAYARNRPQTGGYRADARAFAEWALGGRPEPSEDQRRALEHWLHPVPHRSERRPGPLARLRRTLRPGRDA
ncbi:hypothetical protein SAMN05216371_2576 [Streptomyces sp. TLI_053]|nr:hypothetical protein SAMN05216371_2576 [Streptomyces sp. TLI_053]